MPVKRENILIVHNHYTISGGEDTVVASEKDLLEKKGHKVFIYSRDNKEIAGMSKFQKVGMACSFLFSFRTYYDICSLTAKEKIDIVHVHNTLSLISPSVYYACVTKRIPVVQTVHNFRLICPNALMYRQNEICEKCIESGLYCAIKNRCYHNSFFQTLLCVIGIKFHRWTGIYKKIHYICLTEFNKNKLLAGMRKSIKRNHVYIKPNFVEDIYDKLLKGKREVKDKYCIYVGRLEASKGVLELAEAWKQMVSVPDLVICGGGPEEERMKEIAKEWDNIIYLGKISHKKILNFIFYAEALIFPSKLYEGFPMTILESMMCGTPVICRNVGNGADIVRGIRADMLYDTEEELYNILRKKSYQGYGQYFREAYLMSYSPDANYEIYREILEKINVGK